MKKTKIVIASVLKPVDDTRMYEKFGVSMSQTNKYDINIIGFSSKNKPEFRNIKFYPLYDFSRVSLDRLFAALKFIKKLIEIRPEIVIINTHELIIPAVIYQILFGKKLLYDIRENYYRNIKHTDTFPFFIRDAIAYWVRLKEYLSRPFVQHYLLAESSYEREFSFSKEKSSVIENKCKKPNHIKTHNINIDAPIKILFSGTIAKSTGIFEAIYLAQELHKINSNIQLTIIGHCAIKPVWKEVDHLLKDKDYIKVIGGETLVPHDEILKEIQKSHFGIIHYPTNKSTINSTPTKLYEYLGHQLPILLQNHPEWVKKCEQHQAHIVVDFENISPTKTYKKMMGSNFYPNGITTDIFWESEAQKLINLFNK